MRTDADPLDPLDLADPATPGEPVAELAAFYRHLADTEFATACPPYARVARAVAADPAMLDLVLGLGPRLKIVPVLLFAAVRDVVMAEPSAPDAAALAATWADPALDPWPPFRALVVARRDELRSVLAVRAVQTNEVGRAAAVLPALTAAHREVGRPLALIEVGASAGLNLLLDRFGYHYDDGRRVGDPASPVQLRCEVRGAWRPPLDDRPPPLASAVGIDRAPLDVTDDADRRWLRACLWPGQDDRAERLRAALALAAADPPDLRHGDLVDLLGPAVRDVPADTVPCVVSTWVLAYLDRAGRAAVGRLLDDLGSERDLVCITAEYPGIAPWIERPRGAAERAGATLVGSARWRNGVCTAGPQAWMQAHGRWIEWLDQATADSPTTSGQ